MTGSNLSKIIHEYFGLNTWAYLGDITFLILVISIVTINSAVEVLAAEEDSKITQFKVSQKSVYYGDTFSFSGKLINGLGHAISGATITLWEDDDSKVQNIATAITDVRGKFKATITAEYWDGQGNSVEIFASYPGYGIYKSTKTSIFEINVEKPYSTTPTTPTPTPTQKTITKLPDWIKYNAGWWAADAISQSDFVNAIQYLIKERVIMIPDLQKSGEATGEAVPDWVKSNAGWWASNQISDNEFVNTIQYLIKEGIIKIQLESSSTPVPSIPEPVPTTTIVKIPSGSHSGGCVKTDSCFSPSNIIIGHGTTVTWKNEDDVTHTVLSGIPTTGPEGIFEDDEILSGETFSYTFESTGIYQYFDVLHPWMVGVILVKDSSDSSVIIPFDVETDKHWYQNGDIIAIWGKVIPHENLTLPITLMVIDHNGIVSAETQFLPSEDGSFNYNEFRAGGTMKESGEYEIILQYGSQKGSKTIGYLG